MGTAGEAFDEHGDDLGFNLRSAGFVFHKFVGKVRFLYFDATLERNLYSCRSRHPSWSHLGRKVDADRSKMPSRRGLDDQIWQVSAVLL